ncbi:MAG: adenylosuccinate lyase [Bacteroidales bacterium]|nr:adenylosuccinate lyase [Bacteroidales bacterium]
MDPSLSLFAISPIDGRYAKQTESLRQYFSEFALIKARVFVEVEYFIALCQLPLPQLVNVEKEVFAKLRERVANFTEEDAIATKNIEKTTNHDVKAVEYFVKELFDNLGLSKYKEFIHFGLTSQDINNTATPILLKRAHQEVMEPLLAQVVDEITKKAHAFKNVPMLAHTHGQPASPTSLGKEVYVFAERLKNQITLLKQIPFMGKFGGATGNFNAHFVAYPKIDWVGFSNNFLEKHLDLIRMQTTTQIEHYDMMAAYFDALKRINTILLDFDRDMWTYISMEYFKQRTVAGEVGSSAMPHKVNPIDFENSEGNLGIANAMFEHLSSKLPISRLQRDLTDSTVTRNIGVPIAHSIIAWKSLLRGLGKLELNQDALHRDLEKNWAVVAEAIQTILRRENYPNPYEALKELTRGKTGIDKESLHTFIDGLQVDQAVKTELKSVDPHNYTGLNFTD